MWLYVVPVWLYVVPVHVISSVGFLCMFTAMGLADIKDFETDQLVDGLLWIFITKLQLV